MERLQPVGNYRVVYLIESVIGVDIGSVATGSGHIPTQDKAVEEAVVIRHILVGQISSLGISGSKLGFDLRAGYCSLLKSANAKPPRTSLDNNPLWLICYTGMPTEYPYHGYDISLNFAVRFCMIK